MCLSRELRYHFGGSSAGGYLWDYLCCRASISYDIECQDKAIAYLVRDKRLTNNNKFFILPVECMVPLRRVEHIPLEA